MLAAAGLAVVGLGVMRFALVADARGVGTHEQLGMRPCMSMDQWNVPCPGCGVTTSVTMATQGDMLGAISNQPFGFVVWLLALGYIGWAVIGHLRGRDLWADLNAWRFVPWLWSVGTVAGVSWVYKIWIVRWS